MRFTRIYSKEKVNKLSQKSFAWPDEIPAIMTKTANTK